MNIFNHKNELSINYNYEMEIDGKKWKNIAHYIYSNLLDYSSHKKILEKNLKNISKNFHDLVNIEESDLISKSLMDVLKVRFSNIELARKLLSTGNIPIVYKSSNTKLGVDENGRGQNIYGNLLMEIRKILREKGNLDSKLQVENSKKELIYKAYLVKYFLEDHMYEGYNINRFVNMNLDDIYNIANSEYREENIPVKIYDNFHNYKKSFDKLPINTVINFVEPELKEYPNRVVKFVLKKKLRYFQYILEDKKYNIIYNSVLEYFLTLKNMNNSKIKETFNTYSELLKNKEKFKKFLSNSYDNRKLPKEIQNHLENNNVLKNIRIPTDKEVLNAESVKFEITQPSTIRQTTQPSESKQGSAQGSKLDNFLSSLFEPVKKPITQRQTPILEEDVQKTYTSWIIKIPKKIIKLDQDVINEKLNNLDGNYTIEDYSDKPVMINNVMKTTEYLLIRFNFNSEKNLEDVKDIFSTELLVNKNQIKIEHSNIKRPKANILPKGESESKGESKGESEQVDVKKGSLKVMLAEESRPRNEDIRAILDLVLENKEIPEYLLKKYEENPSVKTLVIETNKTNDVYSDFSPITYDMMIINFNGRKMRFPSISHYLMFSILNKLTKNIEKSYELLFELDRRDSFASLETINDRYRDLLFLKYSEYIEKANKLKFKNVDFAQELVNTENKILYYNDPNDEIIGTGKNRTGGNLLGIYLMNLRSELSTTISVKKSSPLELLLNDNNIVDLMEKRVKDYCNTILNLKNLEKNKLFRLLDKLYPCNFGNFKKIKVSKSFINLVNNESSKLDSEIINYIWNKFISMLNYTLNNSTDPVNMIEKCQLILQSNKFSLSNNNKKAIENAIFNIATNISNIKNEELNEEHLNIATNILLSKRTVEQEVEQEVDTEQEVEQEVDENTNFNEDDGEEISEKDIDYGEEDEGDADSLYDDSPVRNDNESNNESDDESNNESDDESNNESDDESNNESDDESDDESNNESDDESDDDINSVVSDEDHDEVYDEEDYNDVESKNENSPSRDIINKKIKEVIDDNMLEIIKQSRINFFQLI